MEIVQLRRLFSEHSAISDVYIGGERVCLFVEDTVRDVNMDGDLDDVALGEKKIYGETAIPYGRYRIVLEKSGYIYNSYKKASFWLGRGQAGFEKIFKGMLMLTGIKGYSRVHIHIGNYVGDTLGCLLTGTTANTAKDPYSVSGSTAAFVKLYKKVIPALEAGEEVWIDIKKA